MKRKLTRPSAVFFPIAMLVSAVFGDKTLTLQFLGMYFALQITSLCATVAFCNAAAREPGIRRVGRRFWGGIVQLLIGVFILAALTQLYVRDHGLPFCWKTIGTAAFLVIIEQMFEERLFAVSRPVDGTLMALISNSLLLIGIMFNGSERGLPNPTDVCNIYLLGGCAAAALLGGILTLLLAGGKGFTLLPVNYLFAPKALLQTFLYPLAAVAIAHSGIFGVEIRHMIIGFMMWQLSRTVCRRIRLESRPLDWLLSIATAVFGILACLHPAFLPYAICCAAAFACALIVYLAPSVRVYICFAVVLGIIALAYFHPFPYLLA